MQIRSRLTLQFSVLVGGILLSSFILIYIFTRWFDEQQFQQRLHDKAVTAATLLLRVQLVDTSLLKTIDRAKRDILYGENISVYDHNDREVYTNNDTVHFDVSPALLREIRSTGVKYFQQKGFEISGILFREDAQDFVVIAGAIDIQGNYQLRNLRALLVVLFGVMLAIVSAAGWIYAGRALKPVNNLIGEVQAISVQDLRRRLGERRYDDEIGKLIKIINGLLHRIENAFGLQKAFVSNISHELKNPLTKITSQLEVTLLKDRTKEEYQQTTESILEDIRELNMLSGSLLDLASLHEDNETFAMTRLRIDEVLWEGLEKVRSLDPSFHVEIRTLSLPEEAEKLYVFGNLYLLRTAFQNIIENACKFSVDHTAKVSLFCSDRVIQIKVSDNGPGIDKKDLENIFQPFYRADRTSKIKGYGVGLSLCQRIIRIHKGTIDIQSVLGEGTNVTVSFTAAAQF